MAVCDTPLSAPVNAAPTKAARIRGIARLLGVLILGAWLSWQIGAAAVAALATRSSDLRLLAVTGTPSHPDTGSVLANAMLTSGDAAQAATIARAVVLVDPTNDRALRVLGLATIKLGQKDAGAAIMRQAAGLGWRDTPTQLWVLRDAALRGDTLTLVQRTDALARRGRFPQLTQTIFMASLMEPHLRAALIESLASRPTWRISFFSNVRQHLPLAAIAGMEALLQDMRADGQSVTPDEWLSYIDRLIDLGKFDRARSVWARTFAVPASRLGEQPYDATFALAAARPYGAPVSQFEWVVDGDLPDGVTFASGTGGASLDSQLPPGATVMSQLLLLPPGEHSLSARVQGNASAAPAGWGITCLPSGRSLPRSMPRGSNDELSVVAFDVPAAGCGAQRLSLIGRDQLEPQAVSISGVRIR